MTLKDVIADMERATNEKAPWVGIAAVKQWICVLRTLDRLDEPCDCVTCRIARDNAAPPTE